MSTIIALFAPIILGVLVAVGITVVLSLLFRRVVSANTVHIVQSKKITTSYGTGLAGGNVYYRWPSWLPLIGVTVIELPVSNFTAEHKNYEAFDLDKVPFMVDVVAFFRIADTNVAAQRVSTFTDLQDQLHIIVQGAVRKVLAGDKVETIMLERARFGQAFTDEVSEQLQEWGVEPVKSMELMDIRDGHGSEVISNIMAKKTSHIAMESRTEVARNNQAAEMAEISAQREVDIQRQQAEQAVGERTAEKEKMVGIAGELSRQEVLLQEKITRERDMEVKRVEEVKRAEIERDKQIVVADQEAQTTVIIAEGQLEAQKRLAQGIQVEGEANAAAEKAMLMAPVDAQIVLADKIGTNPGYQQYLTIIESIKGYIAVGGEQAKALQNAEVKIISNAGSPGEGMKSAMDLFTSKGGTNVASAIEAFAQSPLGQAIVSQFVGAPAPAKKADDAESVSVPATE